MEQEDDQTQTRTQTHTQTQCVDQRINNHEPAVRSRWTPKPEQILILESIFNSGMVNPPKDETVKIRKLLEKFGSVGDANVFYWFQNRRSRSRRRQRQIQASLLTGGEQLQQQQQQQPQQGSMMSLFTRCGGGGGIQYVQSSTGYTTTTTGPGFGTQQPAGFLPVAAAGCSSSRIGGGDEMYFISGQASGYSQIDQHNTSMLSGSSSGVMSVFINGVPTEVSETGPLNIKGMFGEDVVLLHSSGVAVPQDEFGFSVAPLQHGESYYLVSNNQSLTLNPM